jgi:predicted nucleic acid-binding Zn ribbon protein
MKQLGPLLAEFLQKAARDEEVALIFLKEFWPRIVGPELADHTRPLELRRRRLVLGVTGESWRRELLGVSGTMVQSINRFWNAVLVERISLEIHPMKNERLSS